MNGEQYSQALGYVQYVGLVLGIMVLVLGLMILGMPHNYANERSSRRLHLMAEFGIVSVLALGLLVYWPQIRDSAYGYLAPYLGGAVALGVVGVLVHGWLVIKKDK